jgi:hypothetical protein
VSQAPAHAGSLRVTERLAFVTMFTVMAAFVVGLTVVAAKTGASTALEQSLSDGSRTMPAGQGGVKNLGGTKQVASARAATWSVRPSEVLDARLSTALQAALGTSAAHLSVGVVNTATGAEAVYRPGERFHAGGITRADILAALLYQHQRAGTAMGRKDAGLAAEMIENGNRTVATRLWQAIGRGAGLAAANRALGLRHTVPGVADHWDLTRTTLADQLRLLTDLTAARSVLNPTDRANALSLMARSAAARRWGMPAAASSVNRYAVNDGRRAHPHRFVINSIGVIDHAGHELLVVVLSRNWPTRAAGLSAVRAAALAAAGAMLGSP